MRIRIIAGDVEALAEIQDTETGKAILEALPIEARGNTWGDEIYFSIPVQQDEENAKALVNMGDLGYWPPGNAFCIFFGPTPASRGNEIRPASPVNVFGQIIGEATVFKRVPNGAPIRIEAVE